MFRGFFALFLLALLNSGCADTSADATFSLDYSGVQAILNNGKSTSIRVAYSATGDTSNNALQVHVFPQQAIPKCNLDGQGNCSGNYEWSTATDAGTPRGDSEITIFGVPLTKGVNVFIEVLQQYGDGFWYVVATYCYQGPTNENLTADQLSADATLTRTVVAGRTCGACSKFQACANASCQTVCP